MAQAIPRERVLNVLQRRYDHQSAQVVFKRAVESVKLRDQEQYTREELQSISEGLKKVGDRLDSLIGPLMELAGTTAAAPQTWETPKRESPRVETKPEPPRAADAASVVAVTPPTITPSSAPAVASAPAAAPAPAPTTAEPRAASSTADASSATDAPAASSVAGAEDASSAHHDDGDAEGDNTESGSTAERDAKGRQRRKR